MVTKANRSKAQKRIEEAKRKYGLAEEKTDNFLRRLMDSPVSLLWILVVGVAALGLWVLA
jgi:hypothetical protein